VNDRVAPPSAISRMVLATLEGGCSNGAELMSAFDPKRTYAAFISSQCWLGFWKMKVIAIEVTGLGKFAPVADVDRPWA